MSGRDALFCSNLWRIRPYGGTLHPSFRRFCRGLDALVLKHHFASDGNYLGHAHYRVLDRDDERKACRLHHPPSLPLRFVQLWYAESEFWFALIKICLIIGLIIGGVIVDLGGNPVGERIGFRYWKDPGAFASYPIAGPIGIFTGCFQTLLQAAYSFSGVESIAISCAEVVNPRANMAGCTRKIFWRILFFYFFGIIVVGMLVPSDEPRLLKSTGTAASSPFVIAFTRVGIKGLPSVINAGVLTSAFSAGSSILYGSSRILYGLSLRGQAPKIFSRCLERNGLPLIALACSSSSFFLAYMTLSSGSNTVLNWLSDLTSIATFISWAFICVSFLRFKSACDAQGIIRSESKYIYNRFQPFPAYWALFWCIITIFFNGYKVFLKGRWNTSSFIIAYINIPIVGALFLGHYLFTKRPSFKPASKIDMVSNIPGPEIDFDPNPPTTKIGKFLRWLL